MPFYFVPPGIRFNDYLFTEPVPLRQWQPPQCGGIAALLTRNAQWGPKPLQPLYFVEFGNDAPNTSAAPRLPENTRPEDLLVAVLPMPFSSVAQRRALCKELIGAYNPTCQADGRVSSVTELAQKLDELEARQQEQSQQILSLLSYIGKLFEPQPVTPRRPIGFLPQLAPATGATESGS
jgi:hypothetical protein